MPTSKRRRQPDSPTGIRGLTQVLGDSMVALG
jgi:hypothetical protein